jgi:hypothetical protein
LESGRVLIALGKFHVHFALLQLAFLIARRSAFKPDLISAQLAQPALPDLVAGGSCDGAPIGILRLESYLFIDPSTNTSLA